MLVLGAEYALLKAAALGEFPSEHFRLLFRLGDRLLHSFPNDIKRFKIDNINLSKLTRIDLISKARYKIFHSISGDMLGQIPPKFKKRYVGNKSRHADNSLPPYSNKLNRRSCCNASCNEEA